MWSNMTSTFSYVILLAVDAAQCLEFGTVRGMGAEDQDFVPDVFVLELLAVEQVFLSISIPSDFEVSLGVEIFRWLPHTKAVED